jgi:hypothetical protein
MKKMSTKTIIAHLLLSCAFLISSITPAITSASCSVQTCISCDDCCPSKDCLDFGHTFFAIRPQDSNAARRITKTLTRGQLFEDGFCSTSDVSITWQRSFRSDRLGRWFSFNNSNCMTVGVPGDDLSFNIDGRQFGITTSENVPGIIGKINLLPRIENVIVNFDGQYNLDDVYCGLWARIDLPLVWCRTDLGMAAFTLGNIATSPDESFAAGLFNLTCATTPIAYTSLADALQGNRGFGEVPPLSYGKFGKCSQSSFNVAGIHFDLGYDFIRDECHVFGASVHIVTPTGRRPDARYLFEPEIGANRSWQLGVNMNGFSYLHKSKDHYISFVYDVTITHLFKATQRRLFRLKNNGIGSQYLLLKKFNAIGTAILGADRAANILAGQTKIGADAMVDGALMLQFNHCNIYGNIGYNLWFRSQEKGSKTACFNNFAENSLGIKGQQPLSITQESPCPDIPCISTCIPDMTTASTSTICLPGAAETESVFLTANDIDFASPLHPNAYSNKLFGSIGYTGIGYCGRLWEFLMGGEVEFGHKALSQWGLLIKVGASF